MAQTSNFNILYGDGDQLNKLHVGIASATVLAPGDLVECTGGNAVAVDASSDNVTFAGVGLDYSANGSTAKYNVLLRGRGNVTVVSATYDIGDSLKYSAGANGTAWVLTKATAGADGIMWSLEYQSSAVTNLDVQWDSFIGVGGYGGGAGLWEKHAA